MSHPAGVFFIIQLDRINFGEERGGIPHKDPTHPTLFPILLLEIHLKKWEMRSVLGLLLQE